MSKGSKKVTVGYHYYMNIHFALAHAGVDELLEIRVGERTAWQGNLVGPGSAAISQINLFGGEKREGGVLGVVDFMPGRADQPLNPSLQQAVTEATGTDAVPSYRGISTLFFKGFDGAPLTGTPWETADAGTLPPDQNNLTGNVSIRDVIKFIAGKLLINKSFYWSAMNPYFKNPSFLVRRVWKEWYPAKAQIGEDVNPAHIIYESLTNKDWGLGYPTQDIDNASFTAAADRLYNEGFGLSLKWVKPDQVKEFVNIVKEHINGNVIEDRQTGLFRLTLVRNDYDVATLFELNESNCTVEKFGRKTMSDTVNEVVVSYTRREDGETDTVTAQDLANFANQGRINSQKKDYPGITSQTLANRVAMRDLNTLSKPIAMLTVTANRAILGHYPGDVVKLVWPRLGLNGIVLRIGEMDLGSLKDNKIQMELVEDVFAMPDDAYVTPQPIGWVDTSRSPEPVTAQKLYELSYYELYTTTSTADRLDWPQDVGIGAVSALAPNADSNVLDLYDNTGQETVGDGEFTPSVVLTQPCGYLDTILYVDFTGADISLYSQVGLAWLDDELIWVAAGDSETGELTVQRAMVDTVPARHDAGARVWFYRDSANVIDQSIRVAGEAVGYKLLTQTSQGMLAVSSAPTVNYTYQNRQLRPYRPANLKVDGMAYPTIIDATVALSWAHRDRTQELTLEPTLFSAGNIGPEPGVTYTLEVINEDGNQISLQEGLTNTEFQYTTEYGDLNKLEYKPSGIFRLTGGDVTGRSPFNVGPCLGGDFLVMQNAFDEVNGTQVDYTTRFYFGAGPGEVTDYDEVPGTYAVPWSERNQSAAFNGVDCLAFNRSAAAGTSFPSGWFFNLVTDIKGAAPALSSYQVPWSSGAPLCLAWDSVNSRFVCVSSDKTIRFSADGLTWDAPLSLSTPYTTWYNGTGAALFKRSSYWYLLVFDPKDGYQSEADSTVLLRSTDLLAWQLCPGTDFYDATNAWDFYRLKDYLVVGSTMYLLGYGRRQNSNQLKTLVLRSTDGLNFTVLHEKVWSTGADDYDTLEVAGSVLVAAGKNGTIVSTNSGSTWTQGFTDRPILNMVSDGTGLMALQDADTTSPFVGNGKVVFSLDGTNWAYSKIPLVEGDRPDMDTSVVSQSLRLNTQLRVKLKSVRDGLDSFQQHDLTVERDGYGYNYGNHYGGAA